MGKENNIRKIVVTLHPKIINYAYEKDYHTHHWLFAPSL